MAIKTTEIGNLWKQNIQWQVQIGLNLIMDYSILIKVSINTVVGFFQILTTTNLQLKNELTYKIIKSRIYKHCCINELQIYQEMSQFWLYVYFFEWQGSVQGI